MQKHYWLMFFILYYYITKITIKSKASNAIGTMFIKKAEKLNAKLKKLGAEFI